MLCPRKNTKAVELDIPYLSAHSVDCFISLFAIFRVFRGYFGLRGEQAFVLAGDAEDERVRLRVLADQ